MVLWGAPTPCVLVAALRLPSLGDTRPCACLRLSLAARRRPRAWGFWDWQPHANLCGRETTGPLRFLGNPDVLMPCSWTPAGLQRQALRRLQHGPRGGEGEGSHDEAFRGSIAGPRHALSTLRRLGYPKTTQDSLLGARPASQAGLVTRRVPTKGFRFASYIPSSFPKLS